jgi:hypothetical protein
MAYFVRNATRLIVCVTWLANQNLPFAVFAPVRRCRVPPLRFRPPWIATRFRVVTLNYHVESWYKKFTIHKSVPNLHGFFSGRFVIVNGIDAHCQFSPWQGGSEKEGFDDQRCANENCCTGQY